MSSAEELGQRTDADLGDEGERDERREDVKDTSETEEAPKETEVLNPSQTLPKEVEKVKEAMESQSPPEEDTVKAPTKKEETSQEHPHSTEETPPESPEKENLHPEETQETPEVPEADDTPTEEAVAETESRSTGAFHTFDFAFLIGSTIVVFMAIYYLEIWSSNKPAIFTKEQLAVYDGSEGRPLYVAILGEIFDVSEGERYYGKGKGYHCFVATDGTRAYITGEFVKDLNDDVSDFNAEKHGGLVEWRQFYRDHQEYTSVGVVVGMFYDATGQPTDALKTVEEGAVQAERIKELKAEAKRLHPNCNSKWAQGKGGQVWCDEGHPRLVVEYYPGASEKKRCACFKETDFSYQKQVYENCEPTAMRCIIPPKEKEKPATDTTKSFAQGTDFDQ